MNGFLPVTKEEMIALGWDSPDFVYVSGDAYVDHPSFGAAIITRVLASQGFRVCMLSQPNWKNTCDFMRFGRPKYGFLLSSGNIDSMVAHYTVAKKPRSKDAYSPGGKMGKRPDRAVIVYCKKIREAYNNIPIIIGGLEASLRRFAHYDYWEDKLRPSILFDSGADLLIYGMGEKQTLEVANRLKNGEDIHLMHDINGTCYAVPVSETPLYGKECPSYENVLKSKKEYAVSVRIEQDEQDHIRGKLLKQRHGNMMLVQNPPMSPLTRDELDFVYSLPYTREYHPMYEEFGGVPGLEEVKFSITHNRGCFGACNFCSLAFHQGRFVTSRSKTSVLAEAEKLKQLPDFKGYIHDVGGPTANFRYPSCEKQLKCGVCKNKQCLFPKPCANMNADHSDYVALLRKLRKLPGVKKVFIRSGIRFDYLLADKDETFFDELIKYHISGQLKVAPEHICDAVLKRMGKPENAVFQQFLKKYKQKNEQFHMDQYVVPYLMSSHPGSTLKEAVALAEYIRDLGYMPQQVQDFYPTPSTMSTVMYYTGIDPRDMSPVYVVHNPHEKAMQRALIQYKNPENYELVKEALHLAHREDLIGFDAHALIPPRKMAASAHVPHKQKTGSRKPNTGAEKAKDTHQNKNRNGKNQKTGKEGKKRR